MSEAVARTQTRIDERYAPIVLLASLRDVVERLFILLHSYIVSRPHLIDHRLLELRRLSVPDLPSHPELQGNIRMRKRLVLADVLEPLRC